MLTASKLQRILSAINLWSWLFEERKDSFHEISARHYAIHRIAIYPVDRVIHISNNGAWCMAVNDPMLPIWNQGRGAFRVGLGRVVPLRLSSPYPAKDKKIPYFFFSFTLFTLKAIKMPKTLKTILCSSARSC